MYQEALSSDPQDPMIRKLRSVLILALTISLFGAASNAFAKRTKPKKSSTVNTQQTFVHVTIVPVDPDQKDGMGNPAPVNGKMSTFILDEATGKSYEGTTPFVATLPAGNFYSITLRAPQEEDSARNPASAYTDGFKAHVSITRQMEGQTIAVQVRKKSNRPNVGVIVTGPTTPTTTPAQTPSLPVTAPSSFSIPAGKALIFVGVDSPTLAPTDNTKCFVKEVANKNIERTLDCIQFFSPKGVVVSPGKITLGLRTHSYTIEEQIELQAGQFQSILLKLPGKLKLETEEGHTIRAVQVQIDQNTSINNVDLPYSTETSGGLHQIKLNKDGYYPFTSWAMVEPFGSTSVPVRFSADPKAQAFMCGLCAKTRGKFGLTTEFSVGTPEWFWAQFMMGVADIHKYFKLDVGLRVTTSYYLTTVGAVAQAQIVNAGPIAFGFKTFLGAGGGPNSAINRITFELGPLFSADLSSRVHYILFPYLQVYDDQLPITRYNADTINTGTQARFILQTGFEFTASEYVNLGFTVSWAPGTHRAMYTSQFGEFIYPTEDNRAVGGFYGRISLIIKWPPVFKKI